MIKIKQQIVDTDDICEKVLTDVFVFYDDRMLSTDEYDILCTIIEKTLACVSENPEKLGYYVDVAFMHPHSVIFGKEN